MKSGDYLDNRKIGVFDSGVGGVIVLKSLLEVLPNESYIYIGDNKNIPYGEKTKEELYEIAKRIVKYFLNENVKLIVIACNTISSMILNDLQKEFNSIKIIGVIDSTVNEVVEKHPKNLLIIGTTKTIESGIYEKKIKEKNHLINIKSIKTPLLVPLIETKSQKMEDILDKYLKNTTEFDTILLGCTHYELLRNILIKKYNFNIISSSTSVKNDVVSYLKSNNMLGSKKSIKILTTKDKNMFYNISKDILDVEVGEVNL